MKPVPISAVKNWAQQNGYFIPGSISTVCPHCTEKVTFTMAQHNNDQQRAAWSSSGTCPSCNQSTHFWTIEPKRVNDREGQDPAAIYMYPAPATYHEIMKFTENIPEPLQRSFVSTVDAFNSKNYTATAVCCRRTLEGIFKFLVPEAKRTMVLAKLIEEAKSNADLAKPLSNLSHSIREGGNLGAHFDMEREPDCNMARSMVELVEYLITYLYVLPKKIEDLDAVLGK